MADAAVRNHAAFIWSVADLLRGDYKQREYGKVILPLTVIRRLGCVLEPTKQAMLDRAEKLLGRVENLPSSSTARPCSRARGGLWPVGDSTVEGSLVWGIVLDGFRPDRYDLMGAAMCLVGVAVIMYVPRSN